MLELPVAAGLGLRSPHHSEVMASKPEVAWWEVHSENFFVSGGPLFRFLNELRSHYPLSFHGVGASLGGCDALFKQHLERLASLTDRFQPHQVSEHLCWSAVGMEHFNDLLPLPYTFEALEHLSSRIDQLQSRLKRTILIENPSSYLLWKKADFTEYDFLVHLARQTGCGILLDVNNIYVSAINHGTDPLTYIQAIPSDLVGEIHLAGHETRGEFLLDSHNQQISSEVWSLYAQALEVLGPKPTLIEWDSQIPPLSALMAEKNHAQCYLNEILQDAKLPA